MVASMDITALIWTHGIILDGYKAANETLARSIRHLFRYLGAWHLKQTTTYVKRSQTKSPLKREMWLTLHAFLL
ncbi:hypothetical protein IMY05_010G0198700 [Salix suchowensis]|nr:hypothetical protein IMY05_010G0198700 [Salix suchowensis]